jgi:hypothetical protein
VADIARERSGGRKRTCWDQQRQMDNGEGDEGQVLTWWKR